MRALWALALLAGCGAVQNEPSMAIPLRNPTAPVASQADVTLDRLAGDWTVVAGAGVPVGTVVRVTPSALILGPKSWPLTDEGQGRLGVGAGRIWVHWLDVGNRTAALGDPEGSRVWIMDRTGAPGDRLAPARAILDWYGYDLGRMEPD